jgi:hypothetical protein
VELQPGRARPAPRPGGRPRRDRGVLRGPGHAARAGPSLHAGRGSAREERRGRAQPRLLDAPLRGGPGCRRPRRPLRRPTHHGHRRDAARRRLSFPLGPRGRVAPPGPHRRAAARPGQQLAERDRPAAARRLPARRGRRAKAPVGAAQEGALGRGRPRRRAARRPPRERHGRRGSSRLLAHVGAGRLRAAHRLRQHREPPARPPWAPAAAASFASR